MRSPFRRVVWSLLLLIPLMVSCSPSPQASPTPSCADANVPCLQGTTQVQVSTNRGEITIEVDGDAAPITAGNFVDLVRRGTYDGTMFHRVVREPVPFRRPGGRSQIKGSFGSFKSVGHRQFCGSRNRTIPNDSLGDRFPWRRNPRYSREITNPSQLDSLSLNHERGSVAMARSQAPDSASAQFYIALKALARTGWPLCRFREGD
jgi:peptidyl-prolyl cis-trans isomerase B (cyclophilin B)